MEAAQLQPGSDTFDRILGAESPVVVLETGQADVLVEQFRRLTRRSGQSVYLWQRDEGLRSLREGEMRVPGCEHLGEMLRYALQSMHFGVYLLLGVDGPLASGDRNLLRQIARAGDQPFRRVVLVGDAEDLGASLEGLATTINAHDAMGGRPRLRDGRWVVGP